MNYLNLLNFKTMSEATYTLISYSELTDINIRSKAEENYFHYRKNIYFEMGIEYTGLTRVREWEKAKENVLFDQHGNFFIINGDADRVLTFVTYGEVVIHEDWDGYEHGL